MTLPLDTIEQALGVLGYMCPVCHFGAATPFRCGGPHDGRYDFVDAVPVASLAALEAKDEALREAIAVALAMQGTDNKAGDAISDDIWEDLHQRGLVATASDQTGEGWTHATPSGEAFLSALAARPSEGEQKT